LSSTELENKRNGTGSAWKQGEEVAQTMYTHVSKCKNNKINQKKNLKT
jgi:hypothetical protein